MDLGCCWNFKKKSFSSDLVRSNFIWKDSCNFISSFVGMLLSLRILNVLISKQRKNTHTHTHIYIQEFHVYLQLYCWYLVVFPGLKGSPKPSSIESSDLVKTLNVPTKARSSRFRNRRMLDPSKFVLPPFLIILLFSTKENILGLFFFFFFVFFSPWSPRRRAGHPSTQNFLWIL